MIASDNNPQVEPSITGAEAPAAEPLYLTPRQRPPSKAKERKQALLERSHRRYVFTGKPGTVGAIHGVEYKLGERGNLIRLSSSTQKDRKPTKRGGRGRA